MRTLTAYFSYTGRTAELAERIRELTGSDIFRIEAEEPYPRSYRDTIERAKEEWQAGAFPPLAEDADVSAYDAIFLGFPDWCGTMPRPVFTFLRSHDFSGKRIFPFCTSGGSGLGSSISDIKAAAPGADVSEGFHSSGHADDEDLIRWIESLS